MLVDASSLGGKNYSAPRLRGGSMSWRTLRYNEGGLYDVTYFQNVSLFSKKILNNNTDLYNKLETYNHMESSKGKTSTLQDFRKNNETDK